MIEQLDDFFKEEVFSLLANELWKRYYRNENFGRTVGLKRLQEADTEPLQRLIGIYSVEWENMKSLSLKKFESALKESKFSWELVDFVEAVKGPLVLEADVIEKRQRNFQKFKDGLDEIDEVFTSKLSFNQLKNWFIKNESLETFRQVSKALNNLPNDFMRMPVFSYQQTGDAHTFDANRPAGELLLQMLSTLSQIREEDIIYAQTELNHQLLAEFYLLRDDIKNDVALRGLVAHNNGKANQMWEVACIEGISWNVPLKEILQMDSLHPYHGNKVLVIENSGIYSILVDYLPNLPIICSSGQFTYAVWQVLRKLVHFDYEIHYVGDMDIEGLGMAQQIIDIFPEHTKTIGMNWYNFSQYSKVEELNSSRLKKLRAIKEPNLRMIADEIIKTQHVAYQEGYIKELIEEIYSTFEIKMNGSSGVKS